MVDLREGSRVEVGTQIRISRCPVDTFRGLRFKRFKYILTYISINNLYQGCFVRILSFSVKFSHQPSGLFAPPVAFSAFIRRILIIIRHK